VSDLTRPLERGAAAAKVVRLASIARLVVLVDGLTRSGKSLFGVILASFERVEIERLEAILEYVGGLHRLGKIDRDAAVALLRMETDQHLFNNMIGRNTNFRWEDHSSVWHNPRPWEYVRRLFLPERQAAMARIAAQNPIHQNMTHHQLANFPLYHEALGERLRMVEMIRHPVDLIDSWMRKKKGERLGTDPIVNVICVEYKGQALPLHAAGWEEEYLAASPLGRCIRMIAFKTGLAEAAVASLTEQQRRQLFMVPLEEFIQFPDRYLEPLADFVGTRPTRRTPAVLRKQGLPKAYDAAARDRRQAALEAQATDEEKAILRRLIAGHETFCRPLRR
jgi:hypothetical protein